MPTAVTRTIRKDGMGDYTTFAAMIAELPADFTAYDEDWTVTVADSEEYAENIAISAVMDATRNLTIQAASGQHPTEQWGQYGDATCYPLPLEEYEGNPNISR